MSTTLSASELNQKNETLILNIIIVILIAKILNIIWKKLIHDRLINGTARKLEREIALLQKSSIALNTPSKFVEYSKTQRRWKKREKLLSEIKNTSSYRVKIVISYVIQYALSLGAPICCTLLWYGEKISTLARPDFCCLSRGESLCLPQLICSEGGFQIVTTSFVILTMKSLDYLSSILFK